MKTDCKAGAGERTGTRFFEIVAGFWISTPLKIEITAEQKGLTA